MNRGSKRPQTGSKVDVSILRQNISGRDIDYDQLLSINSSGPTPIRNMLHFEARFLIECRCCREIFRGLANFVSHKRRYCVQNYPKAVQAWASDFAKTYFTAEELLSQESDDDDVTTELVCETQISPEDVPLAKKEENETQSDSDMCSSTIEKTSPTESKDSVEENPSGSVPFGEQVDAEKRAFYESLQDTLNAQQNATTKQYLIKFSAIPNRPDVLFQELASTNDQPENVDSDRDTATPQDDMSVVCVEPEHAIGYAKMKLRKRALEDELALYESQPMKMASVAQTRGLADDKLKQLKIVMPHVRVARDTPSPNESEVSVPSVHSRASEDIMRDMLPTSIMDLATHNPSSLLATVKTEPLSTVGTLNPKLCKHCGVQFTSQKALDLHRRKQHPSPSSLAKSEKADKAFVNLAQPLLSEYSSKSSLTQAQHRPKRPLKPSERLRVFDDDLHQKHNTGTPERKKNAGYVMQMLASLAPQCRRKLATVIDTQRLQCRRCWKIFSSVPLLQKHATMHFNWRRFKCKLCKFVSFSKITCREHLRTRHRSECPKARDADNYMTIVYPSHSEAPSHKHNTIESVSKTKPAVSDSEHKPVLTQPETSSADKLPSKDRKQPTAKQRQPDLQEESQPKPDEMDESTDDIEDFGQTSVILRPTIEQLSIDCFVAISPRPNALWLAKIVKLDPEGDGVHVVYLEEKSSQNASNPSQSTSIYHVFPWNPNDFQYWQPLSEVVAIISEPKKGRRSHLLFSPAELSVVRRYLRKQRRCQSKDTQNASQTPVSLSPAKSCSSNHNKSSSATSSVDASSTDGEKSPIKSSSKCANTDLSCSEILTQKDVDSQISVKDNLDFRDVEALQALLKLKSPTENEPGGSEKTLETQQRVTSFVECSTSQTLAAVCSEDINSNLTYTESITASSSLTSPPFSNSVRFVPVNHSKECGSETTAACSTNTRPIQVSIVPTTTQNRNESALISSSELARRTGLSVVTVETFPTDQSIASSSVLINPPQHILRAGNYAIVMTPPSKSVTGLCRIVEADHEGGVIVKCLSSKEHQWKRPDQILAVITPDRFQDDGCPMFDIQKIIALKEHLYQQVGVSAEQNNVGDDEISENSLPAYLPVGSNLGNKRHRVSSPVCIESWPNAGDSQIERPIKGSLASTVSKTGTRPGPIIIHRARSTSSIGLPYAEAVFPSGKVNPSKK